MNEFISTLLGGMSAGAFWAYLFMAVIGFVISYLLQVGDSQPTIKSGGGFSLGYWIKDNWSRVTLSFLAVVIAIPNFKELFGADITNLSAMGMAFSVDVIIDRLRGFLVMLRGKK